MIVLAVDLGNTHVKVGVFQNNTLSQTYVFLSSLELSNWPNDFFSTQPDQIVVANVSHHTDQSVAEFFSQQMNQAPLFVSTKLKLPFQHHIIESETLGADRIAHMAFVSDFKTNCLVMDLGTFLTMDYFDAKQGFLGGAIFPGMTTTQTIYKEKASRLKDFMITVTNSCYGQNTEAAMQSGLYMSYKYILQGFIQDFKTLSNKELKIFATGGGFSILKHEFPEINFEPHLTLKGLFNLSQRKDY